MPKDPAMRDAYREIYDSCHMRYGLGAPFTERFFDLALAPTQEQTAGFVGLIVANSFMKREFGAKLIQEVLPRLDLTCAVDCSGAYIPGHGTPTVILFGRNRPPVESTVRTVRGIRGEPSTPEDSAQGLVWSAITAQVDLAQSLSDFISTEDTPRNTLAQHPWNMGGGGAAEVQKTIEGNRTLLGTIASEIGITSVNGEDDIFTFEDQRAAARLGLHHLQALVVGDTVRDYRIAAPIWAVWPHGRDFEVLPLSEIQDVSRHLWLARATLSKRKRFGTRMLERGLTWYEFQELYSSKLQAPLTISFAFVATHNHFVLDRGGKVFNRTAPVIKLPPGTNEDSHLNILGLLNSSTACFWLKQVGQNRGSTVDEHGARQRTLPFEDFYEFTAGILLKFPVAEGAPLHLARALDACASRLAEKLPLAIIRQSTPTRDALNAAHAEFEAIRAEMIALQEELDWHCYGLYGLCVAPPQHSAPPPLRLGERAFEILMARQMAAGALETTWFSRHGSSPRNDVLAEWPKDYRAIVEERISLIETDATIALIERPEFKRRWAIGTWVELEQAALRTWLLDRLEALTIWSFGGPRLFSTNQLADLLRRDADFLSVAALYAGRTDVNLEALVAELIARESVPFLAVLRYAETGLRKRAQWEATWDKQRREDAIDAEVAVRRDTFRAQSERRVQEQWQAVNPRRSSEEPEPYGIRMQAGAAPAVEQQVDRLVAEEQRRRKREEVGDIPVPPKYVTKDFQSTDFWRLRGGLDVPKERFVSFPHSQRDADGSLVVTWAGHNHLKRALAIAAYYQERKDSDGWPAERLVPLLAGVIELVPWLLQWHNEYDPDLGARMGDYFVDFVQTEARALGMTEAAVAAWIPPATPRRGRTRRAA